MKEIESKIKKLKTKLAEKGSAGTDQEGAAKALRETRKKLKRAQRRKKVLTTRAVYIESKGKKKEKKGEGEKAAPG